MSEAVTSTDLPLPNKRQGKVRDLYDLTLPDGSDGLLIIATDRVSVFDVVLGNGIPGKGKLLTSLSTFWFDFFSGQSSVKVPHHLVSTDARSIPDLTEAQYQSLDGRIMICRKSEVVPIESIVRGYITGSGWKDYQKTGQVCGIELPVGLQNSSKIDEPIFTPSTKAAEGHDENISFARACELVGTDLMTRVRDTSLLIYTTARDYAGERGIIIADTKFEFGMYNGELTLIDEVLTPDSSRFWPAASWEPGREQDSFDKQYVRNYTEELVAAGEWNKEYPGPSLPPEVIEQTLAKYREAIERLTA
jgi:phosphoribosylaminoimidazole-succinocarboxamide synthase